MTTCKVPIGLLPALREVGVALADVLAAAGLPAGSIDAPGQRLAEADYFAFWRGIRQASGDPNIGARLAASFKPDLTEPLFLAVLSAENGAAALEMLSTYKRVLTPQRLAVYDGERAGRSWRATSGPVASSSCPRC